MRVSELVFSFVIPTVSAPASRAAWTYRLVSVDSPDWESAMTSAFFPSVPDTVQGSHGWGGERCGQAG